jgi:hypothetical protein
MGIGRLSRVLREVGRSPPSIAEVKNEWSYTSIPPSTVTARTGATETVNTFILLLLLTSNNKRWRGSLSPSVTPYAQKQKGKRRTVHAYEGTSYSTRL